MREGSGRGLGRVGSDFLSAIAGRVNFSTGRVGSKKKYPWTTLQWTSLDPDGEFTTFSKTYTIQLNLAGIKMWYVFIFGKFFDPPLGKDKNVCLKGWTIHQIARFQVWIFKIFLEGLPKPSPQIHPTLNFGIRFRFGLRPPISGASCPRFGLHPQFTPNMFDHFPKQGKLQIKYFTPLPQLLGYATVFYNSILQIVICRWAAWAAWAPPIFQTSRRLWKLLNE